MRFLRWVVRVLKGTRDRILWILNGIFGPPGAALRRVLLSFRDKFDEFVGMVLNWWANIWGKAEKDEKVALGNPSIASLALASFVLAVSMYTWTSWETIHGKWFYVVCFAIWLVSYLVFRTVSYPHQEGRFSQWVRQAGERPGLVWWERLGAAAGVVLIFLSRATPHLLPLAAAVTLGFLRFLVTKYKLRRLRHLHEGPVQPLTVPSEAGDGYEQRHFHWTMRAGVLADDSDIDVAVHVPTYDRMKGQNPHTLWNGAEPRFDRWVLDGATPEVDRAAYALQQISEKRHYSTYAKISNALAFVQAIPYSLDEETTGVSDYWRYPIETLYDRTGDCEDTTILAAAVLRRLGHRVGTMLMPEHAALAVEAPPGTPGNFVVHDGRPMYYCETTQTGWQVGEIPPAVRGQQIDVLMIDD